MNAFQLARERLQINVYRLLLPACWVVGALLLVLAWHWPARSGEPAPAVAAAAPSPRSLPERAEPFGALRFDAAMGDLLASRLLTARLLEEHERTGDSEPLYEAMYWLDRHWDSDEYRQTQLLARVFERHCGRRLLRWHWLCNAGE